MSDRRRFYVTEKLSEHIGETPEGFLVCYDVPITRTGEFLYKFDEVPVDSDPSGMIRIQRDEEEVFREETLKSFEGKPVTINHPNEAVTPENWKKFAVGTTQNVRRGENGQRDLMLADLLITTEEAIELVKSGLREISCGYDAEYEQIEKGLGRQKEIVGNHVALVMKGRAGNRCAIGDSGKVCDGCGNCGRGEKQNEAKEVDMKLKSKFKLFRKALDSISDEDLEKLEKVEDQAADLPVELKKIKDMYDRWIQDAAEGKLDVSNLPVELKEVKDQKEEEDLEDKDKEKAKDKKACDQKEEEEEEGKTKDQLGLEGEIEDLKNEVQRLTEIIEELVASDEEVHAVMENKAKEQEEFEKAKQAEEEKEATKDCETNWSDIAYRANLLFPEMKLKKPTRDFRKSLRDIKISALKGAFSRDETREAVIPFVRDGEFSNLTKDALNSAFVGAAELIAMKNNKKVQSSAIKTHDFGAANVVRNINERNREFYKR